MPDTPASIVDLAGIRARRREIAHAGRLAEIGSLLELINAMRAAIDASDRLMVAEAEWIGLEHADHLLAQHGRLAVDEEEVVRLDEAASPCLWERWRQVCAQVGWDLGQTMTTAWPICEGAFLARLLGKR